VDRNALISYWRRIEADNAPKRVEGHGITPRHRLVAQARLRLRVLDPEVKVWCWRIERQDTGLLVCERRRHRLGHLTGIANL
jgi:hypothetical protein